MEEIYEEEKEIVRVNVFNIVEVYNGKRIEHEHSERLVISVWDTEDDDEIRKEIKNEIAITEHIEVIDFDYYIV